MKDFLDCFPMKEKDNYNWKDSKVCIQDNWKTKNYIGVNKQDDRDVIIVKEININKDIFQDREYFYHKLQDINLSFSLRNYEYFPKKISGLISEDQKTLYLIINENNVSLNILITSKHFNYLDNKHLIKWIIYQISFGLYILHTNNIIHHDIKPSNIVIDEKGRIEIIDFDSAIFKNEQSYQYTLPYSSPEILIGNRVIDEKTDIWSLGIITLELYLKRCPILYKKDITNNEEQLYFILEKIYGIKKEKYPNINDLNNILNNDNSINIQFNIEQKILEKVDDEDAKLLLNNLLNFDPRKRYTSKEVLQSNYLKEYLGIDSFDIKPIKFIINNDEISKNKLDKTYFLELIKRIIHK